MFVLKQCTCGSTDFDYEDDTLRCMECGKLARFEYIPDNEEKGTNEE